ncbi:serine hydrolase [Pseudoalteromonas sp. MMG012]|uniref:serine hydrolase domain-containing protein n=1 Tax=Pseudoalteromonas sp. MMG012 TaxID=2822686 RepID=UPI001B39FDD8|nr:serine hydrolase domain-containing protein [Pseudoalteromonas sp. MMG012]MBQ4848708.1 beta-lactamase family protein [Pseudoalteromonas sp. MMG012]
MFIHLIKRLTPLSFIFLAACTNDSKLGFESFVEKALTQFLIDEDAQVVSIAIVSGQHNYQNHFGQFPNGTKPGHETIYEIASITKTYTGLLLAKAVTDKKVKLDDDIRAYLGPDGYQNLQYLNQPITLRHLATHRSALPQDFAFTREDLKNGRAFELILNYSKSQLFEDLSQYQLTSRPGSEYQYSNVGTELIGYTLENVYNKPFSMLVTEFITEKSGEEDTKFRITSDEINKITKGVDEEGESAPLLSPYSFSEGGLTSTTDSITRYMHYLLTSNSADVTLSQTLLAGSANTHGHAFFWNTYKYDSSTPMLYHSGGSIGTSSWLALYPELGVGIFLVTNIAADNTQDKLNEIANIIVDKYTKAAELK